MFQPFERFQREYIDRLIRLDKIYIVSHPTTGRLIILKIQKNISCLRIMISWDWRKYISAPLKTTSMHRSSILRIQSIN